MACSASRVTNRNPLPPLPSLYSQQANRMSSYPQHQRPLKWLIGFFAFLGRQCCRGAGRNLSSYQTSGPWGDLLNQAFPDERYAGADPGFAVIISPTKEVLDGRHRLCKANDRNQLTVPTVTATWEEIARCVVPTKDPDRDKTSNNVPCAALEEGGNQMDKYFFVFAIGWAMGLITAWLRDALWPERNQ